LLPWRVGFADVCRSLLPSWQSNLELKEIKRSGDGSSLLFVLDTRWWLMAVDGWRELAGGETGVIIDDSIKPIKNPK
jgi:hypothetical protein